MHDEHPHPLLAQVPLTLSPFLSLPTATPLPYSYKTLPSTLPPSILSSPPSNSSSDPQQPNQPPAYVTSATGTSATPDQILTSCIALQEHLRKMEEDARRTLREWEDRRQREDLAEKRRVAPGWLDSGVHIIKPEEDGGGTGAAGGNTGQGQQQESLMDLDPQAERKAKEGEELDRVFGGLKV
ncbi:hypothetical protein P3342_008420 [Pyrenophora teres f. teres]|uniref:Uncharacterized protein n=1 Tax=Pyrenophora teres f. teres TaxID=97479 RepID=A0A6S6WCD6_9PLEO|nr:hypothetical protein HRS9122_09432 [Pyrenophora teres f. teres]KAE8830557.1 hypothetical protein PTNB85_07144 [Pyrenophora teres f. teres]KAE8857442.1 hypothetical protein PTNB29_08509 [Pyrenophora teres f. teres]KAK1910541.1 hypothetical protein P3342_008420 [Pyrenophora teres f. teres]CAE7185718.1 hypothetical protein PTTW11_06849 [Pyrenophora teres f. teres]